MSIVTMASDEFPRAEKPYFKIPLNLPHAGRVAWRISVLLPAAEDRSGPEVLAAHRVAMELTDLLRECFERDDNPPGAEARRIQEQAAALGRKLVDLIERGGLGGDRLGQCVRNLFECLELGQEGAEISLRAGEDPHSMQRPF